MALLETANVISISDAGKLGVSALVQEAEEGREQVILRDNKPVAVIMSVERFERLQGLLEDLTDLTLAASRMATTGGSRHTLDEILERFGYTRQELAEASEHLRSGQRSATPVKPHGAAPWNDLATHPLIGKWRIVEMDMWDRDYLDLVEPAYIAFNTRGAGDFAFGVVTASLDCWYSPHSIEFTWEGSSEGDEVSGAGSAEIADDGTVTGDIRFHYGDESGFKARRW